MFSFECKYCGENISIFESLCTCGRKHVTVMCQNCGNGFDKKGTEIINVEMVSIL